MPIPPRWVDAAYGLRVDGVDALEPFAHAFTHFTLAVTPWRVRVKGAATRAGQRPATWLALRDAPEAALPAPVKKLLARLARGA